MNVWMNMFCPYMGGCICKAQKMGHCAAGVKVHEGFCGPPWGVLKISLLPQYFFLIIPNFLTQESDTGVKAC